MQRLGSKPSASHSTAHSSTYGSTRKMGPDVYLRESKRLDCYGGKYPSVCLNNSSTAVVVHNSSMGNSMWYWVGRLDEVTDEIFWTGGRHFDYGLSPSVALKDSGLVVEVHRSQWRHELKYTLGKVDGDYVKWGACQTYANGVDASVAANDSDTVVAVHVSNGTRIQCIVGEASSKSMRWGSSITLGSGSLPRVAINNNNTVVTVYQSPSQCSVQCQIGIVNRMLIHWGKCIDYANGLYSSVSLTAYDRMLTLRQGQWLDELLYGVAKVNPQAREIVEEGNVEQCRNRKLKEHNIPKYCDKTSVFFWHPSISINDQGKILAVYASNSGHGRALWYHLGSLNESEDSDPSSYYGSDEEQYLSTPSDDC